jgi:hypothetical protein
MDDRFKLTTTDNPYNPFTEWEAWFLTDWTLGYNTCGLLARTCGNSDLDDGSLSDAMKRIVKDNFSGRHILVTEKEFDELIKTVD